MSLKQHAGTQVTKITAQNPATSSDLSVLASALLAQDMGSGLDLAAVRQNISILDTGLSQQTGQPGAALDTLETAVGSAVSLAVAANSAQDQGGILDVGTPGTALLTSDQGQAGGLAESGQNVQVLDGGDSLTTAVSSAAWVAPDTALGLDAVLSAGTLFTQDMGTGLELAPGPGLSFGVIDLALAQELSDLMVSQSALEQGVTGAAAFPGPVLSALDPGTSQETGSPGVTLSAQDTGLAEAVLASQAFLSILDSALASALTLSQAWLSSLDLGSSQELVAPAATFWTLDLGSSQEGLPGPLVFWTLSDAGNASEAGQTGGSVLSILDTALSLDWGDVATWQVASDRGTGTADTLLPWLALDQGTGLEQVDTTTSPATEGGAGLDLASVGVALSVLEQALGNDLLSIRAVIQGPDTGLGQEQVSIHVCVQEQGQATDLAGSLVPVRVLDQGQGAEEAPPALGIFTLAEPAQALEQIFLDVSLSSQDLAGHWDNFLLSPCPLGSEQGLGQESVTLVGSLPPAPDWGLGQDQASVDVGFLAMSILDTALSLDQALVTGWLGSEDSAQGQAQTDQVAALLDLEQACAGFAWWSEALLDSEDSAQGQAQGFPGMLALEEARGEEATSQEVVAQDLALGSDVVPMTSREIQVEDQAVGMGQADVKRPSRSGGEAIVGTTAGGHISGTAGSRSSLVGGSGSNRTIRGR